jgi:hypothetical protein
MLQFCYKTNKFCQKKTRRSGYLSFCYEVCLTLSCLYQAANANCESFAVTLFCFFDRVERLSVLWVQRLHFALNPNGFYIAGLSISILLTQSILCQAHHKETYKNARSSRPSFLMLQRI